MKCYTPEHLADMFGLYFVRNKNVWYGCEAVPQFICGSWQVEKAKVCVIVLAHYVLSVVSERDSLTCPQTPEKRSI